MKNEKHYCPICGGELERRIDLVSFELDKELPCVKRQYIHRNGQLIQVDSELFKTRTCDKVLKHFLCKGCGASFPQRMILHKNDWKRAADSFIKQRSR